MSLPDNVKAAILNEPERLSAYINPDDQRIIMIRPLEAGDADALGEYLRGLSPESQARFGPHPFDQETIDEICANLNHQEITRIVATAVQPMDGTIVAYFLVYRGVWQAEQERYAAYGLRLDPEIDCTLAPSVADDYQSQGLGSMILLDVLKLILHLDRRRVVLWGGTQASNEPAIGFYQKFGFEKVGEFTTDQLNYDMILDLTT